VLKDIKPLVEAGFSLLWLRERTKRPVEADWTNLPTLSYADLKRKYREGMNVGVRLGKPSKVDGLYLHVIDMDIRDDLYLDDAIDAIEHITGLNVSEFPTVISGSGGKSRHFYFLCDRPLHSKKLWRSDEAKKVDGKSVRCAEVELFGTGKQVALPPSIHPDTAKRYRWKEEFDERHLPEIDADQIEERIEDTERGETGSIEPLGLSLGDAEHMLEMVQPWADDRDTWLRVGMALKHEFGDDGWVLFDRWSKQGRGYDKRENRAQWKTFKTDRRSLVTMRTIAKEAREAEYEAQYDEIADEFEDLPDEEVEPVEGDDDPIDFESLKHLIRLPKHLWKPPGVLGDFVDYYMATAKVPQPQLAVLAALALGSVVCGRGFVTDRDNYSSAFFAAIAETAAGKEHIKKTIEEALVAGGAEELIGYSSYTSNAGVISALLRKPKHITITDEFGRYLMSSRKSGDSNKADEQSTLMEIFGRADGRMAPKSYSTMHKTPEQIEATEGRYVVRPALTYFGLTTPEVLYKSLGAEDVNDGFLNRFIFMQSDIDYVKKNNALPQEVPKSVSAWIREHFSAYAEGEDEIGTIGDLMDPKNPPEPEVIPFTKEASDYLDMIDERYTRKMRRMKRDGSGFQGLWGRTREKAMRLSLFIALSDRRSRIGLNHIKWASDFVEHCDDRFAQQFVTQVGRHRLDPIAETVAKKIASFGPKGVSEGVLLNRCRPFANLESRDREEVIDRLLRVHGVRRVQSKSKRGRSTAIYIAKGESDE